jgi:hypothetical protein
MDKLTPLRARNPSHKTTKLFYQSWSIAMYQVRASNYYGNVINRSTDRPNHIADPTPGMLTHTNTSLFKYLSHVVKYLWKRLIRSNWMDTQSNSWKSKKFSSALVSETSEGHVGSQIAKAGIDKVRKTLACMCVTRAAAKLFYYCIFVLVSLTMGMWTQSDVHYMGSIIMSPLCSGVLHYLGHNHWTTG